MIRIVIPAYNEVENIPDLFADLRPYVHELRARVIVVDDGSADGTVAAVHAHRRDMDVAVIRHPRNLGLGGALNTGLRAAIAESAGDDAIVTLEADNTSRLSDLPAMLERFAQGADLVLASVHAPGGEIIGVDGWRVAASKAVSNAFRVLGGLREVHTLSSLYRVYRAETLSRAAQIYGHLLVREPGFAVNVELLLKLHALGAKVTEVPTVNDWRRRRGSSKLRVTPTIAAYARLGAAHVISRAQPAALAVELGRTVWA